MTPPSFDELQRDRRQAVMRGINAQAEREGVPPDVIYRRLRTSFVRDWHFWLAITLVIFSLCSCGRLCVFTIPAPHP